MKRLFVLHTQYQLILAAGIASPDDDLVLFCDFALSDALRSRIENRFWRCLFLCGNYPKREISAKAKAKKLSSDCGKIARFMTSAYDEIIIVDDVCVPEMFALKCAYRLNRRVVMSWLEDGSSAYYSNGVVSGGMGATPMRRFVRKVCFTLRYRLFGFYDLGVCMGAHRRLTRAYLTFPDDVRHELRNKIRVPITDDEFKVGLAAMYADSPVPMDDDCILVALDKLEVYGDRLSIVDAEVKRIVEGGKRVYCKYHPRETQTLKSLDCAEVLDSTIAVEHYLANTTASRLTVVGVMSTSLQTAKKLGFDVVSLAECVGASDDVRRFYRSIGIEIR